MAWRMKQKLPAFKVTQRSPGNVIRRNVARGKGIVRVGIKDESSIIEEGADPPGTTASGLGETDPEPDLLTDHTTGTELSPLDFGDNVSLHYIKQKASTSAWGNIRQGLLKAAVESSAMPVNQCCVMCTKEASYRCIQCSSCAYYCHECFGLAHTKVNIFHTGEIWQVNEPFQICI